jgi:hypothetical protein
MSRVGPSYFRTNANGKGSAKSKDRGANGFNSGMGEIFRKVCAISPISEEALMETAETKPLQENPEGGQDQSHVAIPNESEPSCERGAKH